MMDWPENAQAALTLSFDDGFASTYQSTAALLHQRCLSATYNIITGKVGSVFENVPTATWQQWEQAVFLEHEISSHSAAHFLAGSALSDLRRVLYGLLVAPKRIVYMRQLSMTRRVLRKWSSNLSHQAPPSGSFLSDLQDSMAHFRQHFPDVQIESFAYPSGKYHAAGRNMVAQAGFKSARTLDPGLNGVSSDPFALRAVIFGPGLNISDLFPWLDLACRKRAWLIVVFHLVADHNPMEYPYFCSLPDFERLLDAIQSRQFWVASQGKVARCIKLYKKDEN